MFLYLLSPRQGTAFQRIAAKLIRADGISQASEMEAFAAMSREMGLPITPPESSEPSKEDFEVFDSRGVKIAALLELIGLGHSDSDYSSGESKIISEVADAFGISKAEVMVLENWVLRQYALLREVKELLGSDKKED